MAIAIMLPYTPLGGLVRFARLPLALLGTIALFTRTYLLLVQTVSLVLSATRTALTA